MGPLFTAADEWSFVLALVVGIFFGFILESAGFSTSRKLAGVFYGYDFVVLKVFFMAAVTAAIGLAFMDYFRLIDMTDVWVNRLYVGPAILGGSIMGLGFIIGGFCPGTSACAAAIGKIDAMLFLGGFMLGIVIFDLFFPLYSDFYTSGKMGPALIHEQLGMSKEVFILLFMIFAIVAFYATAIIQRKVSKKSHKY